MRQHGTIASYNKDRCRCDKCREALRLWTRKYRNRTREHNVYCLICDEGFPNANSRNRHEGHAHKCS